MSRVQFALDINDVKGSLKEENAMFKKLVQPLRRLALAPTGIRSKLMWAFLLMSAVPLVMLLLIAAWFAFPDVRAFYQLDRWFPLIANPTGATWWLISIIALTIFIALLGSVYLTIKIIEPVIQLSHEATQLAKGEYDRELPISQGDELGDLTHALNQLTGRIRENMLELKQFGERTTQINLEIQKRVVMLSGLLQIGELISTGAELEVVLDLVVEKVALLDDQGFSFLSLQPMEELPLALRRTHGVEVKGVTSLEGDSAQAVIDAKNPPTPRLESLWEQLDRPNLILQPLLVRNRHVGVLGVGNRRLNYAWSPELVDLVAVFAKQTSIALENEVLIRKAKALAIRDELTGVYNETYVRQRLAEEIKRAVMYQRPCAFAMFTIQDFARFRQTHGEPEAERALKKVARLIQESVTEIDRVGRFNGNELVVLLPERNKRQAFEIAEEIRRRVAFAFADAPDPQDRLTLVGGVAENPIDGVTAEELIEKAASTIHHAALASENRTS